MTTTNMRYTVECLRSVSLRLVHSAIAVPVGAAIWQRWTRWSQWRILSVEVWK